MKEIIESSLSEKEILIAIGEDTKPSIRWTSLQNVKGVLYKRINVSNEKSVLNSSDFEKLKLITRKPVIIKSIEVLKLIGEQKKSLKNDCLTIIFCSNTNLQIQFGNKAGLRLIGNNFYALAIGDNIGFTVINRGSSNPQLTIFFNQVI